jgi:hypothetical protein
MKKYVLVFAVTYLLLTVVLGVITEMLKIGGGAGLNIAATIASSFIAAWRFTQEQGRLPTAEENNSYARLALASVWVASLLLVVAFLLSSCHPLKLMKSRKYWLPRYFSSQLALVFSSFQPSIISLLSGRFRGMQNKATKLDLCPEA